jgi:uncharacterized RDD family membrane protein YckC
MVDTLLIGLLQTLVNVTVLLVFFARYGDALDLESSLVYWGLALVALLSFAISSGYYIFFEMIWNGQSPGKRLVGLRAIRGDGMPITLAESAIRNLVRLVDFLPVSYGVGIVAMFIDTKSRRLGDLAAGTLVVWDRVPKLLDSPKASPLPTGPATPLGRKWAVERLSRRDLDMAEDFLRRRSSLANRQALAEQIASALLERMNEPSQPMSPAEAETILEEIVAAARR